MYNDSWPLLNNVASLEMVAYSQGSLLNPESSAAHNPNHIREMVGWAPTLDLQLRFHMTRGEAKRVFEPRLLLEAHCDPKSGTGEFVKE